VATSQEHVLQEKVDVLHKQADDMTRENASLRHQLDELEVKVQLNGAADAKKIRELLSMDSTLKKDLRASERERQLLESLLQQAGSRRCSPLLFTLPSVARQSQKRRLQQEDTERSHKRLDPASIRCAATPNEAARSLTLALATGS
jgi:predicted RNase H-like nuclease (RuvC/YqgF family)